MMRFFVKLTYHRPEKKYGATSGNTNKAFYLALDCIEEITPYPECVKIKKTSGEVIEVSENIGQVAAAIAGARELADYGRKPKPKDNIWPDYHK